MPGASDQVASIISFAKNEAQQKARAAQSAYDHAMGLIGIAPKLKIIEVERPDELPDPEEVEEQFNVEYAQLMAELRTGFADFFEDFFPLDADSLATATNWISNTLTNGGSGINASVESQLWNRDRSRILEDSGRAEDEAITSWAARGFPTPPGAATYQLLQIRKDAQAKIAEVSRTAAIKSFDAELENMRFAVTKAIEYQVAAVNAAGEYMKVLALPAQLSAQVLTAKSQARAALAQAAVAYYNAKLGMQELLLKADTTNVNTQNRTNELNANFEVGVVEKRVAAAIAAAGSLGTQAAAALNALHAQAAISGNDSTITNL